MGGKGLQRPALVCVLSLFLVVVSYGGGQPSGVLALGDAESAYAQAAHVNGSCWEIFESKCFGL